MFGKVYCFHKYFENKNSVLNSIFFSVTNGKMLRKEKTNDRNSLIESSSNLQNQLIGNRFMVGRLIGHGSFGFVHEAYDNVTGKRVAIKFEDRRTSHSQLKNEYRVCMLFSFFLFQSYFMTMSICCCFSSSM